MGEALKLLYSAEEAASALDIDRKTLLAHIRAGDIRYVLIGRGAKKQHRKFTRSDLEQFIKARQEMPCPSTSRQSHRTGISISSSKVIGFSARLAAKATQKLRA